MTITHEQIVEIIEKNVHGVPPYSDIRGEEQAAQAIMALIEQQNAETRKVLEEIRTMVSKHYTSEGDKLSITMGTAVINIAQFLTPPAPTAEPVLFGVTFYPQQ